MPGIIRASVVASVSLLLVNVVNGVLAGGVEQTQWERYRTDNDEFSVVLPTVPAMRTRNTWRQDLHRSRQERFIGAYVDGIAYAIHIFENVDGEKLESFSRDYISKTTRWESNSEKQFFVNDVAGRQFLMADKTVGGVVQFFVTPQRLYRFEAVGAGADDLRISQFFSSLSFASKPGGKEIADGIGMLWKSPNPLSPDQNTIFTGKEVHRRMIVVAKPDPQYTELARQNRVVGRLVLKAVFSRDGAVEDITVVSGLPDGLTDQAVYAAKLIKFIPALKDGHFVSTWIQLEYNFNLY
jgi:TonB family protein